MEFRILGPVEVVDQGENLQLNGPAERRVLGLLLCLPGEVVPVNRLIDELWGDDPPASARNMIQRYVSGLRKSLGTAGGRLTTEPGGYRIAVDRGEIDWCRFKAKVSEVSDLNDPAAAAVVLTEALVLWRGAPLADAGDGPTVTAERVQMEEARLSAIGHRIDSDLGLGRHRQVVAELEGLVGRHPLRERFRSQLMLALHRCDRQADALRSYADYRELLAEETGLEPSPTLAELESQILLRDPLLDTPLGVSDSEPKARQLAAVMFADMVGFTTLMQEDEPLALEKRARFREVLEGCHEKSGGTIVQYYGDGALTIFPNSVDAVLCATSIQQELSLPPEVEARIGIHVGDVVVEASGLIGDAVNVASRIESFGTPGAVLISDSVQDQVKNQPQLNFVNLGHFELENVARPFEIFALDCEGLAIPNVDALTGKGQRITIGSDAETEIRTNLPHRLTEFIGRATEIKEVQDLIPKRRLVTLAGTGGIGKTSLAVRAATELLDDFTDGVWFAELAALTDENQIAGVVASLFGVETLPGQSVTQSLARELTHREALLIIDNCEHLIDGVAKFTDALLRSTEQLRVVATSREPLRIDGEAVFRVPSLSVPPMNADIDRVAESDAVALLIDRAKLAQSSFSIDGQEAFVGEICRHLDGIPLAIELAAARLNTMTVAQIAEHLDNRFELLTKRSRSALPRHQTLHAMIDWSHTLLTEPEQVLLRRLGAFGGPFTPAAAQAVCGYEPLQPDLIADLLNRLTETSMVLPPQPGRDRYSMLETIRAYALQHLETNTETDQALRRLADYLLEAGPPTDLGRPKGGDYSEWFRWRADELENFRTALNWSLTANRSGLAGRLAVELTPYLESINLRDEAEAWNSSVLDRLATEPTPVRLRLIMEMAVIALESGRMTRARSWLDTARYEAGALGDESSINALLAMDAKLTLIEGDLDAALAINKEAAERLLEAQDPRYMSTVLTAVDLLCALGRYDDAAALVDQTWDEDMPLTYDGWDWRSWLLGSIASSRGEYNRAAQLLEGSLETAQEQGSRITESILFQLSFAKYAGGDIDSAHQLMHEARSLSTGRTTGFGHWEAATALIELEINGVTRAAPYLRDALDLVSLPGQAGSRDLVLLVTGEVAFTADRPEEAAACHAASVAASERIVGLVDDPWTRQCRDRAVDRLRRDLPPDVLERHWKLGLELSFDEAADRARAFLDEVAPISAVV